MPRRQLWVTEAGFEQQGSFCDAASGHHYENTDNLGSRIAASRAHDRGDEVIVVDAPSDPDDTYGPGQRFNLYASEKDSQGSYSEAKYGPGR